MTPADALATFSCSSVIQPLPLVDPSHADTYVSGKTTQSRRVARAPLQPGIFSTSLGRPWVHKLSHKINMASKHGFRGIELSIEDLDHHARDLGDTSTPSSQLDAARSIRRLCDERDLDIICLQPFMHYEGLRDRLLHEQRIDQLHTWFQIAKILKTDMILIPASFLPSIETTGDITVIVKDLIRVADLGRLESPVVRFAYESLCWSTYIDTWEKCWDVVQRVDRPNFGICLDTYNIAGRVFADPTAKDGCVENAEEVMRSSIEQLVRCIDPKKVFFIQVVDAERLTEPLVEGHEFYNSEQPARMSWSRNCRLFYGEEEKGAYLPIRQLCDAIINGLDFRGWVSMEMFNRCLTDEGEHVPEDLARRGMQSYHKMMTDLGKESMCHSQEIGRSFQSRMSVGPASSAAHDPLRRPRGLVCASTWAKGHGIFV